MDEDVRSLRECYIFFPNPCAPFFFVMFQQSTQYFKVKETAIICSVKVKSIKENVETLQFMFIFSL